MPGYFTTPRHYSKLLLEFDAREPAPSDALFDDMARALEQRGMRVGLIVAMERKKSFGKHPMLELFFAGRGDLKRHGLDNKRWAMVGFETEHSRWIIDKWAELCKRHGFSEQCYGHDLFLSYGELPDMLLYHLMYQNKPEILAEVGRVCVERGRKSPTRIYVSSQKVITILFNCPWHLKRVQKDGTEPVLHDAIHALLAKLDRHGCYDRPLVRIRFEDFFSIKESVAVMRED